MDAGTLWQVVAELLVEPFRVVAYPIETVLAEKIVTMIDRGDATTRERDFAGHGAATGRSCSVTIPSSR
ncbi:MAG: nucleotidyl transferase AbiEii/AbiGii toxin family protein [Pseudonocardiaceae bacterium]